MKRQENCGRAISKWELLSLLVLALLVRAAVGITTEGVSGGDWQAYSRVAANILRGCGVSLSDPAGQACLPHFGGNGLPGYPAFVAAVWAVFGTGQSAVLWGQAAIGALAIPYLAYAVARMSGRWAGFLAGLIAALSPLQAFMVRYGVAEALTIGAANWLLAELALSVAQRRLRVVPIACAITVAMWLRLDSVLFLIPVAVIGLWLHGFAAALARGTVLAILIALPLGLWTARNAMVGISIEPVSSTWMLPDGTRGPQGYLAWLKEWVTTPDQRSDATWFEVNEYNRIRLAPEYAYSPEVKAEVDGLISRLRAESGHPFPPDIDAAFKRLAEEKVESRSVLETAELRIRQGWGLWGNWATPLPPELAPPAALSLPAYAAQWAENTIAGTMRDRLKAAARLYRFLLGLAFVFVAAGSILLWRAPVHVFALATLGLMAAKSILAVSGLFLEDRYTVTAVPAIELTTMLGLHGSWLALRFRHHGEFRALPGSSAST